MIFEKIAETGEPVFLTKNGYGSMVLLSLEQYSKLTECTGTKETAGTVKSESDMVNAADSVKGGLFKNKKKSPAAPMNPELQREAEEKNLGKHTMLDHEILPLSPGANAFRI